ncbi:MAG: ABC transporter permease, partial [Chloroflexota bacterium]
MTAYIARRLLQMIPIALGLAALIFLLIHLIPGDPALVILGPHATPDQVARLHAYWHLDDPLWTQFYFFIVRLLHGDLGTSIVYQDSVLDLLVGRMPVTLLLAFLSMLLSVALAVPLAVVATVNHGRLVDRGLRLLTFVGFAMPSFWLAMLLMILFGVNLHWLPVAGYGTAFGDHLYHLILPIVVVSLSIFPLLLRTLRASLLEVVGQDYVRTARAKGLASRRVLFKHVLRNALLPTITIVGLNLGSLLSGTVVIESVFALPGVGYLLTASVNTRDYPSVQGAALALGMLYVVVNMVTDLSYS